MYFEVVMGFFFVFKVLFTGRAVRLGEDRGL